MGISTGRLTEPEETAALIAFLASDRSGNLTGIDVLADGGVIKTV
jgi:putative oxidoreductase